MIGVMQGRLSIPTSNKIQEFPWETWEVEFEEASNLGINKIEWTLDHSGLYENPIMTKQGRVQIKSLSTKHNILIDSITLDCFLESPVHKVNSFNNKTSDVKTLIDVAKCCNEAGIKIGVLPLVYESGEDNADSLRKLVEILAKLDNEFQKLEFQIALECELTLEMINWIHMNTICLASVGFNFDMGNSASIGNNPTEEISILNNRILNVHIKDRLPKGKTVPLGTGIVNFALVSEQLSKIGYSGNYILQAARKRNGFESLDIREYLDFCKLNGWS
jgi:L-ribulose-5-phosphate 3-epimerase